MASRQTIETTHQLEDMGNAIAGLAPRLTAMGTSAQALEPEVLGLAAAFDYVREAADLLDRSSLSGLRAAFNELNKPITAQTLSRSADLLAEVSLKARDAANTEMQKIQEKADKEQKRQDAEDAKKKSGPGALAALSGFANSVGPAIGGTIGALLGPFQSLTNAIGPFVAALNPSLMQAFSYVMRNLMATIGVALVPVLEVLKGALQSLTVTLYPAMKALAPILGNLADVLIGNLIPIVGMIVDLFVTLAPILEFVTDLLSAFADVQRVLMTVIRTVIQTLLQTLSSLFGGVDLKGIAAQFRNIIETLSKQFVLLSVYIAKLLNSLGYQNNFIDNLLKNLRGLKGEGEFAHAAPQNVGMKSFEQIGKDIAVAAFSAQAGGTGKKETNEYLDELVKAVNEAKENNKDLKQFVRELLEELAEKWFGKSLAEIETELEAFLGPVLDWVKNPGQKTRETYNRGVEAVNQFAEKNPITAGILGGFLPPGADRLINTLGQ